MADDNETTCRECGGTGETECGDCPARTPAWETPAGDAECEGDYCDACDDRGRRECSACEGNGTVAREAA